MRAKLKKSLGSQLSQIGLDGARAHMHALERAITQIELASVQAEKFAKEDKFAEEMIDEQLRSAAPMEAPFAVAPEVKVIIESPRQITQIESIDNFARESATEKRYELLSLVARSCLVTAAIFASVYAVMKLGPKHDVSKVGPPTETAIKESNVNRDGYGGQQPPVQVNSGVETDEAATITPVPKSFGAFAVSGDKFYKLEALSLRIPDERIQIGPVITSEPKTKIPGGPIEFLIYRRDLAANTPDRATVRVISRIQGSVTFANEKATRVGIGNEWAIRNQTYQFGVYPVANDQQMIRLRPIKTDLVLPSGRYALILKDQVYDFEIEGGVTDPIHCLEKFQSTAGTVYSPCKP
jgi:hypothetical protein